jgi:diadenosine tetraphosphate (Ap4A) HIT family hydrolase
MSGESIYDYQLPDATTECPFCEQFLWKTSRGVAGCVLGPDYRREIHADADFVVVATLGQLVEGWLLVIPRVHYSCVAVLPRHLQSRFSALVRRARAAVEFRYGPAALMEHGSVSQTGACGTCIEHAHLHIVPRVPSLAEPFAHACSGQHISGLETLWVAPPTRDYLYYESPDRDGYLALPGDVLPCQYFRRLVANAIGRPGDWDWRRNLGVDAIKSATAALTGAI